MLDLGKSGILSIISYQIHIVGSNWLFWYKSGVSRWPSNVLVKQWCWWVPLDLNFKIDKPQSYAGKPWSWATSKLQPTILNFTLLHIGITQCRATSVAKNQPQESSQGKERHFVVHCWATFLRSQSGGLFCDCEPYLSPFSNLHHRNLRAQMGGSRP